MRNWNKAPYTSKIKWRIRLLWLLLFGMLAYIVVIGELGGGDSRIMTPLADAFSRLVLFGGMIYVGIRIHRNKKLLENSFRMKQKQQEEVDERNRYLHQISGGVVLDIVLVVLVFVTLTASLFDMHVFYVCFGILTVAVAAKAIVRIAASRGWMA